MRRHFRGHGSFAFPSLVIVATFLCLLCGCTSSLDSLFGKTLPPDEGVQKIPGIAEKVTVKRDNMGVPFIDAASLEDLIVAMGYISACDRFAQMEGFRLVGQGRLSEMAGQAAVEMDIYLRAMGVNKAAEIILNSASADLRHFLKLYSDGVNAYLDNNPLPMMVRVTGHKPEKWEPIDSISVFLVLTLGLAQNLHEEIGILNLAQKISPEKLAWLTPIYPDEPLPFTEMKKLEGLDLTTAAADLENIFSVICRTNKLVVPAAAASNNWVVSGRLTKSGKPILANDTHLPLVMPSFWHLMKLRCPTLEGAGVALAGVPGIIAGYNGHIAAGMTMVMADNQDVFLEKLQQKDDGLYYLYKGDWIKTATRDEVIKVKGGKDVSVTVHETVHGPLMNRILAKDPRHLLVPMPTDQALGIAVSWAAFEPDRTMDVFFNIMRATSVDGILTWTASSRTIIPLNLVMADEKDIAWQVTGRFPVRKGGRGLCPSPGWTGEYDWEGFLNPSLHPVVKNPEEGFIGTANNRTVPADFTYTLSSSWYYPDRAGRIRQLIEKSGTEFTAETARAMQADTFSPFVGYIKQALLDETTLEKMKSAWSGEKDKTRAEAGLKVLREFNGFMNVDSAGAAFCGAFMSCLSKNLFADECGGTDTLAWKSLAEIFLMAYSAHHDHLSGRCQTSPFWDDVTTTVVEQRHEILARTVLDAIDLLEEKCGPEPEYWQWGKMHHYEWLTDASRLAPHMGFLDRLGMKIMSGYIDRGPFPAPGDHTTLNVSGYHPGRDFDTWLIPAMRIIVDFGSEEPMVGINSSGQSDNPASPHYDDGIFAWMKGEYQNFPFQEKNIEKQYTKTLLLTPEPCQGN
ncbi:MAG: penicillin acylase family protein [Thermodesulfobacteriota bacterium]